MTLEEKKQKLKELELKARILKREADYYNARQLALKLVLNGSYGAFAARYFVMFNNNVAGTITAQGRELTRTMDEVSKAYWHNIWHLDTELHKQLYIKNVTQVSDDDPGTIYGDTDSIFVSFKPAIDTSEWRDQIFNNKVIKNIKNKTLIITSRKDVKFDKNPNIVKVIETIDDKNTTNLINFLENNTNVYYENIIIDGEYVKSRTLNNLIKDGKIKGRIIWNWSRELDFIQGIDKFRFEGYLNDKLEELASSYGVENQEVFELEKISESIINIAKKKYIMNIVHEDGIDHDRLSYIYPKGVELIRSDAPVFARERIYEIVNYLFSNPKTYNAKDLLSLVKKLRKEFELADVDDISRQSGVSNYNEKTINDRTLPLQFVNGAHYTVKAAGYYNYLLSNSEYQEIYKPIKSGDKIKMYYCKDTSINPVFAFHRGAFPIEIAPQVDYDLQFEKTVLSIINGIIEPLNLPLINQRLAVVMDIFSGFKK